jgi:hypothetical protein
MFETIYTINTQTKTEQKIFTIDTLGLAYDKRISPDGKFMVGMLADITNTNPKKTFTAYLTPIDNPNQLIDLSSFINIPIQQEDPEKSGDIFFVDNDTIAFISYQQKKYQHADVLDSLNTPIKIILLDLTSKKINKEIPIENKVAKHLSEEPIIDINKNGTVISTQTILKDNNPKPLPANFIPISFLN